MKKNYSIIRNAVLAAFALVSINAAADDTVVTFEDLTLESESVWKGPDTTGEKNSYESWGSTITEWIGKFTSNGVSFSNTYNETYASWSGFAYSNSTSTEYKDYTTDCNSVTGGGYDGSKTFAVGYYSAYGTTASTITISETGANVKGCYVTNNTYAYNSMANGDSYAKKFAKDDYFKLIFTADNGNKAEFYLANMTSDDVSGIVKDWQWFDLTSLGSVKTITVSFESSDTGDYGINTPTYFCMDNLTIEGSATGISNAKASDAVEVARYTIDGKLLAAPAKGINIIKMSDGTTRKVVVK